ncbi:Sulfate/bicarbonate/oxalate exchanger SAT-1 and related transporters (SLC26 family) [Handroanthus impetiginosus]|uniref:Sulfate/bicarbonate/oxalate exchanger SAT-1 and related transporters (SLC26 family) n=1 Tax=Handroanthus impetiginosus TaxID=429701 RepID=A0A2G9GQ72_9LAMI|nr:Sulfate/bicarbonate/oxalate exchanger SAT-1 and related transporters (SLC26 family) [Handroanthus impetiginosus]
MGLVFKDLCRIFSLPQFPQTLQKQPTIPTDNFTMELQQMDVTPANGGSDRSKWLLSSPDPPPPWQELFTSIKEAFFPQTKNRKAKERKALLFLQTLFPILKWGRNYKATKFKHDLMAGLTLASLCIPQSIVYANLAKLDPQYGLYTSVVPPLVYALMGSSREIAIGPVAVVSLLLSAMISKLVDPSADPVAYLRIAFTVTFFSGTFQALFGLFRLGFLIDFLSHAAIVGFMGGAAIVIGLQQLKGLLGLSHFTNETDVVSVLEAVAKALPHEWYPLNFVLGCSFLIFILITRFIGRRNKKLFWIPAMAPLFSVILSTLIVYLTKADKHGVKIVKHFKGGLNPISVHQLNFGGSYIGDSAKIGLICALVALTEAIGVGRSFASIKGYHLDGNKEMVAMGFMNIVGSFTSCYTATGSFSRTAVNFAAGCETVVSNIVMAITVLISLLLFTRLLYYTPLAILASIILSALPGLIDINEAYSIWKVDKLDFLVCVGAFCGVLFHSVEIGLLVAVVMSFAKIIISSIKPSTEVLGRLPGTDIFCNMVQFPVATKTPGISVIRINSGTLCFANANFIKERIVKRVRDENEIEESIRGGIRVMVLDMTNVMNIDTSGIHAMEELHKDLTSQGIELAIANPRWQVITKIKAAKFVEKIGPGWIFLSVSDAVETSLHLKINGLNNC